MTINIYFHHLKQDIQEEILRLLNINSEIDMNWNIKPLMKLEFETERK